MTYTIKKLQQWDGQDAYGCRGEIHHDSQGHVADFHDDGNGGGMWVEPAWKSAGKDRHVYRKEEYKEFETWAEDHPAMPLIQDAWGWPPEVPETTIEVLIVEHEIAKNVKKGYLVYQEDDSPLAHGQRAKQGRKVARYNEENSAWLKKELPAARCRNEVGPVWEEAKQGA